MSIGVGLFGIGALCLDSMIFSYQNKVTCSEWQYARNPRDRFRLKHLPYGLTSDCSNVRGISKMATLNSWNRNTWNDRLELMMNRQYFDCNIKAESSRAGNMFSPIGYGLDENLTIVKQNTDDFESCYQNMSAERYISSLMHNTYPLSSEPNQKSTFAHPEVASIVQATLNTTTCPNSYDVHSIENVVVFVGLSDAVYDGVKYPIHFDTFVIKRSDEASVDDVLNDPHINIRIRNSHNINTLLKRSRVFVIPK